MARTILQRITDFEGDIARHLRRWRRHEEAPGEVVHGVVHDARKFWYRLWKGAPDKARKEAIHCVKKGMEAFNLQSYDRAEMYFRRALHHDAEYARAHLYLGNTLFKRGRLAESVTHWERARVCEPQSDAAAHASEKLAHLGQGDAGVIANLQDQMKRR